MKKFSSSGVSLLHIRTVYLRKNGAAIRSVCIQSLAPGRSAQIPGSTYAGTWGDTCSPEHGIPAALPAGAADHAPTDKSHEAVA
jgi:hypothetical protein